MSSGERHIDDAEERLRDIQSLTDSSLGYLDVDDLLEVLLGRVRVILNADTAVVLLLEEESNQLVARAAAGLPEEVRQGVRVPVGLGFAGRIAAERRTVSLDRVEPATVTNPILWERGIKSMLGSPLLSGDNVLGVIHVGSLDGRTFDEGDAELLELVAGRISSALQARSLEVERAAARVLQRSLLPTAAPIVQGLEFATRYVPAEGGGVGGDWYDVFCLPVGDVVWVMTGDVAGHGLRSAVIMGRVRSTMRSYALEYDDPGEVLERTNAKLMHFETGEMATVVCAVFQPPYDHGLVSIAGHPPPVLAVPDRPSVLLETPVSPPLGVTRRAERTCTPFDMPSGAVLLMYTDGLIERRRAPIDAGLELLRSSVRPDGAEQVCKRVMDDLVSATVPEDDIAVLAVRRS